jgi:hypothetical protein
MSVTGPICAATTASNLGTGVMASTSTGTPQVVTGVASPSVVRIVVHACRRDGRRAIVTGHGGRARSRTAGPPKSSCGGCRTRPRWAPRISGELRERLYKRFPHVRELTPAVERTGVMPPVHPGGGVDRGAATTRPGSFCGFCHRPQQLRGELRDAGLTVAELVSVEGPAFLLGDLAEQLEDPVARAVVLDTARALESVPELLGIGPHLLATGIRP